jgi:hypothetical protein
MQVHVYLNLTLLLNKGIASRQVNVYYVRKDGIPPQAQVSEVDQL